MEIGIELSGSPPKEGRLKIQPVRITTNTNRVVDAALVTIREAKSGLFWWTLQLTTSANEQELFAKQFKDTYKAAWRDHEIVVFTTSGRSIWARSEGKRCPVALDCETEISSSLPAVASSQMSGGILWEEINTSLAIGLGFFVPKQFEADASGLILLDAKPMNGGWRVTVKNNREEKRDITLGNDFKIAAVSPVNQ